MTRQSAIYEGVVRHRRAQPVEHAFRFKMFMMYIDLEELSELFEGSWLWSSTRRAPAWFRRADYLGPSDVPLDTAVRDHVEAETRRRPCGPIRMLTHLRYFGYAFNPVTFYYCFDSEDDHVETIVAEITNTPWKERRAYVLAYGRHSRTGRMHHFRFGKDFHVSPFMPMDLVYDWRLTEPSDDLQVQMSLLDARGRKFDADLHLERREITPGRLRGLLLRYPFMTARVITRIHWEALRLWIKGCPVYPHPDGAPKRSST